MLRLREYVEDELDRSVELPGKENLEIIRELDDCRLMPMMRSLALSSLL
jgi:hypothetical protein